LFEVSKHLICEAKSLASELVGSGQESLPIRSTGFYVTVNPDKKVVIHRFEHNKVFCYITMGN
jgi:hypothetical protein